MNFGETDEQQMIRELVRDFAETVLAPTVEHRDQNQLPPAEEWEAFLEYGLHGITIPEATGAHLSTMSPRPSSSKNSHGSILPSP